MSNNSITWESQCGFAAVACHAAIELDNILEERTDPGTAALQVLIEKLSYQSIEVMNGLFIPALVDPLNELAVYKFFQSFDSGPLKTIDDLKERSSDFGRTLKQIIDDPTTFRGSHIDDLKVIRDRCLTLSRILSGSMPSPICMV